MNRVILFLALCFGTSSMAQVANYQRYNATGGNTLAGFFCQQSQCGATFGWLTVWGTTTFQGQINTTGDVHSGTLTADGAMTSGSISSGVITGTELDANTVNGGSGTFNGSLASSSLNTGTITSTSLTTGAINASSATVSGAMSTPAFTSDAAGNITFAKPLTVTTTVCATTSSPVALSTLNTATQVAALSSPALKPTLPCLVVPPSGLNVNVDFLCRITATGAATIYAKTGLVGLSAAAGQWCAVVVGQ